MEKDKILELEDFLGIIQAQPSIWDIKKLRHMAWLTAGVEALSGTAGGTDEELRLTWFHLSSAVIWGHKEAETHT